MPGIYNFTDVLLQATQRISTLMAQHRIVDETGQGAQWLADYIWNYGPESPHIIQLEIKQQQAVEEQNEAEEIHGEKSILAMQLKEYYNDLSLELWMAKIDHYMLCQESN